MLFASLGAGWIYGLEGKWGGCAYASHASCKSRFVTCTYVQHVDDSTAAGAAWSANITGIR